ncbi:hypothetical protein FOZ63_025718, partial [Perkinsus olseni]
MSSTRGVADGPVAEICRVLGIPAGDLVGSYYGEIDPLYNIDDFSGVLLRFCGLEEDPEGHRHVSERRAACAEDFEGFPRYLREHRNIPSPAIENPLHPGAPMNIHDRNSVAAASGWPGLEADAVLPMWMASNAGQLRRSRVPYFAHTAGAPTDIFYNPSDETIPDSKTETVSLILTLHGSPFVMNPPPEAEAARDSQQLIEEARAHSYPDVCDIPTEGQRSKIRDCTLWGMLHSCLIFPCSKAIMCVICKAVFKSERAKASKSMIKHGKLFLCEDFSWYNALKAFAKHSTNPTSHHYGEVFIEGLPTANRFNNVYPIVTVQGEALRGITMTELLHTKSPRDFPGTFCEVVRQLREFVLERESLAIQGIDDRNYPSRRPSLGPANARLEYSPGFDANRPYIVWQNTCPLHLELNAALIPSTTGAAIRLGVKPNMISQKASPRVIARGVPSFLILLTASLSRIKLKAISGTRTSSARWGPESPAECTEPQNEDPPLVTLSGLTDYPWIDLITVALPKSSCEICMEQAYILNGLARNTQALHQRPHIGPEPKPQGTTKAERTSMRVTITTGLMIRTRTAILIVMTDFLTNRTWMFAIAWFRTRDAPASPISTHLPGQYLEAPDLLTPPEPELSRPACNLQAQQHRSQPGGVGNVKPGERSGGGLAHCSANNARCRRRDESELNCQGHDLHSSASASSGAAALRPGAFARSSTYPVEEATASHKGHHAVSTGSTTRRPSESRLVGFPNRWTEFHGIEVKSIFSLPWLAAAPRRIEHDPERTFSPASDPLPFFKMLPRTSRREVRDRRPTHNAERTVVIEGEDYSYMESAEYKNDPRIARWRRLLDSLEEANLICPLDRKNLKAISHPLVAGAAVPGPRDNQSGRVALLTGLYSGAQGKYALNVPKAGTILEWLANGNLGVLYVVVHSKNKLVNSPPQNVASLGFCCRPHLEAFLSIFRRWELRRPLRSDGPNGRPTMTFLVRSREAFDTDLFETNDSRSHQEGQRRGWKKSGLTIDESVLNRVIILARESWHKRSTLWTLSTEDQRPHHIPWDGWIREQVDWDEYLKANRSSRCENNTWSVIHSLRNPAAIAGSFKQ